MSSVSAIAELSPQSLSTIVIHFSPHTNVPDDFMTSVSAHCGLVHVVMKVGSLTVEGITSLVRNSPELITLHLCTIAIDHVYVKKFDTELKEMFRNRKLFTVGHYMVA